ncbi:MAG: dTDP-4-dehydrorhamnose 3,5-epimerase family protein [Patescibacteria group bacterium]
MIKDVQLKQLNLNFDDRGFLVEVLKKTDPIFKEIKQTTYTETYPGVIKAFHWHKRQWDFWFIIKGMAQVVLYDLREDSPTKGETNVFYLGEKNLAVLAIPPGVAHGYRVLGNQPIGLLYQTTEIYNPENPDEGRISFDDKKIGFDWTTRPR